MTDKEMRFIDGFRKLDEESRDALEHLLLLLLSDPKFYLAYHQRACGNNLKDAAPGE